MILIKTKIGTSTLKGVGIGLFADQFIPKGTMTWKYHPKFDTAYTEEDVQNMSEPARKIFLHYAYYDIHQNKYILCFDDQRFINHSKEPNIISETEFDVASRDIQPGEELFCDYRSFEKDYFERRNMTEVFQEKNA